MKRLLKKTASYDWIQLDVDKKQAVNDTYGEGDDNVCTWFQSGILNAESLDDAVGMNGEDHDYHVENGEWYMGNYPEAKWKEFLKDVEENGVREPIEVRIYSDGRKVIVEGNHRLCACFELQKYEIPANVRYYGQSQKNYMLH